MDKSVKNPPRALRGGWINTEVEQQVSKSLSRRSNLNQILDTNYWWRNTSGTNHREIHVELITEQLTSQPGGSKGWQTISLVGRGRRRLVEGTRGRGNKRASEGTRVRGGSIFYVASFDLW